MNADCGITNWIIAISSSVSAIFIIFYVFYTKGLLKSSQEQINQLKAQRNFDLRKEIYLEFVKDINTFFAICEDIKDGKTPSGVDISDFLGLLPADRAPFVRMEIKSREYRYIEIWVDRINSICEKIKFCSSAKLRNTIDDFNHEFKIFHITLTGFLTSTTDKQKSLVEWLERFNNIKELKDKIVKLMEEDLGITNIHP